MKREYKLLIGIMCFWILILFIFSFNDNDIEANQGKNKTETAIVTNTQVNTTIIETTKQPDQTQSIKAENKIKSKLPLQINYIIDLMIEVDKSVKLLNMVKKDNENDLLDSWEYTYIFKDESKLTLILMNDGGEFFVVDIK